MTVLKFGGKFEKGAYQTSGGLHGVGVTVVNFLSQWADCRSQSRWLHLDSGIRTRCADRAGIARVARRKRPGPRRPSKPTIRSSAFTKYNFDTLYKRLQELAFLNSGVHIKFHDERNGEGGDFLYERGLVEFVEHLNRASDALHSDVIRIVGEKERNAVRNRHAVQHRVHRERAVVCEQHSHDRREVRMFPVSVAR